MNTFNPLQNLTIEKTIGKGGFGEILLANTLDGRQYAIKRIPKTKNQADNIVREARAGLALSHKNISHFVTQFEDGDNDYLVFEYIRGKQTIKFIHEKFSKFCELPISMRYN